MLIAYIGFCRAKSSIFCGPWITHIWSPGIEIDLKTVMMIFDTMAVLYGKKKRVQQSMFYCIQVLSYTLIGTA